MSLDNIEIDEQWLKEIAEFPLVEALFGRRSRRFFRGAEIPDGALAYKSEHEPLPNPTGLEGVFVSDTPPHFKDMRAAVAHIAQYVYDPFGKFPATVPSVYSLMYLQTHHLDLDYYDKFFGPHS